jgi:hypothetical protein
VYQTWISIRKILLLPLLFPLLVQAQDRCGTVEYQKKLQSQKLIRENTPEFEQWLSRKIRQRARGAEPFRTKSTYRIPVVVHVIHNGEPVGTGTNISDSQVLSQIAVLNKDYQRLNSDASNTPAEFLPMAGSMDIEFALAKRSPEGLPTNGIVRVNAGEIPPRKWTSHDNSELKALSYWAAEDYLNIWVCDITDYIGYSQFPVSDLPGLENSPENRLTDGVVIAYNVFGSVDYGAFNLDANYNKGRTTTHEIGHFLGLRHTWGDDAGKCINETGGKDDYVSDTPDQAGSTSNCPNGPRASCTVSTMYQNYLDYTDDECMNLFTEGQINRMIAVLESSPRRASLLTSDGLNDPDPVTTENLTLKSVLAPVVTCEDQSVIRLKIKNAGIPVTSFKVKATINGNVSIVDFTDLDFPTGDEENFELPVTSFTNAENLMTFEVYEPNGEPDPFPEDNTATHQTIVNDEQDFIPLKETFDQSFAGQWSVSNPSLGMTFQEVATNFNTSLYFNGYSNVNIGDASWLVSPVLDLSSHAEASLFFDLSYAYRSGSYDNLKVLASTDCGQTFDEVLFDEIGTALSGKVSSASWKPSVTDDWTRKYVSLSSLAGQPDVRLAFVFTNDNGNNLYLDNIEFFTSDDPTPPVVTKLFSVYPNPGKAETTILTLNLPERANIQIEMTDAMGKLMFTQRMTDALNQTIPLPLPNAVPGLYFVRVIAGGKNHTQKLILTQP